MGVAACTRVALATLGQLLRREDLRAAKQTEAADEWHVTEYRRASAELICTQAQARARMPAGNRMHASAKRTGARA
jgi:hypothetical protein